MTATLPLLLVSPPPTHVHTQGSEHAGCTTWFSFTFTRSCKESLKCLLAYSWHGCYLHPECAPAVSLAINTLASSTVSEERVKQHPCWKQSSDQLYVASLAYSSVEVVAGERGTVWETPLHTRRVCAHIEGRLAIHACLGFECVDVSHRPIPVHAPSTSLPALARKGDPVSSPSLPPWRISIPVSATLRRSTCRSLAGHGSR